ncbi:MAG: hypothetical protein IKE58_00565 [Blautia sp.]|nr:hypothetical protein [Blautia sp.]
MKEAVILSHPDPKATNTEDEPDHVRPYAGEASLEDGLLCARLKPLSWNVLRFKPC